MKKSLTKTLYLRITHSLMPCLIIISLLLSGCSAYDLPWNKSCKESKSDVFFDTLVNLTVYADSSANASYMIDECISKCRRYESLFNERLEGSDIYRINHSQGKATVVDPETIFLLKSALKYCEMTDGAFDITIFGVSELYDFHEESHKVPEEADIKEALAHVDYHNIVIDDENSTVTLKDPSASIDIGGIAKGYIADKLAEYLSGCKARGAVIDIGGDISTMGTKDTGSDYKIGIKNPDGSNPLCTVKLKDMAIATSGTYERCFTSNGRFYHHIIDTATGYPADTDLVSASIITAKAMDADTLCTISILYGSEKALELIDSIDDTEAILLTTDGSLLYSKGAEKYISSL